MVTRVQRSHGDDGLSRVVDAGHDVVHPRGVDVWNALQGHRVGVKRVLVAVAVSLDVPGCE
jgi:hypothetical protein